ncbi:uncharacterized protein LOC105262577 [Musca domestica]|uniref:Uncharacterized protein LOC105262577 n=1 Tax=Musca domestica TaxID=7370 RepID=A0A1I8NKQ5_MUSDO|nr:uncharacterized protein LOC105262577 [Musca domestica]
MRSLVFIILTIALVEAVLFPKLPKLVMRYDDSEEDGALFKWPKFDLFDKPSLKEKLLEKEKEKVTLLEKLADKKEEKFEDRLWNFFDDKDNVKTVLEKLKIDHLEKTTTEKPCKCPESHYDECGGVIRYFS